MNLGTHHPRWEQRAACRTGDTALWMSEDPTDEARAAAICATCPVRLDCLDDAMDLEGGDAPSGRATVRGGLGPRQRADLHKATRLAQLTRRTA